MKNIAITVGRPGASRGRGPPAAAELLAALGPEQPARRSTRRLQGVFPLLFYKRISDAWDESTPAPWPKSAATSSIARSRPTTTASRSPTAATGRDLRRVHENVGVALQKILDRIQQANPETLAGIFGDVAWGNKDKLPEHVAAQPHRGVRHARPRPATGRPRRPRQRLRVPAQAVRRRVGQEGRRVLHARARSSGS